MTTIVSVLMKHVLKLSSSFSIKVCNFKMHILLCFNILILRDTINISKFLLNKVKLKYIAKLLIYCLCKLHELITSRGVSLQGCQVQQMTHEVKAVSPISPSWQQRKITDGVPS